MAALTATTATKSERLVNKTYSVPFYLLWGIACWLGRGQEDRLGRLSAAWVRFCASSHCHFGWGGIRIPELSLAFGRSLLQVRTYYVVALTEVWLSFVGFLAAYLVMLPTVVHRMLGSTLARREDFGRRWMLEILHILVGSICHFNLSPGSTSLRRQASILARWRCLLLYFVFRQRHSLLEELVLRVVSKRVSISLTVTVVHLWSHGLAIFRVSTVGNFGTLLAAPTHHSHVGPLVHPVQVGFLELCHSLL